MMRTASSLARVTPAFGAGFRENFFVLSETIFGADRACLHALASASPSEAKANISPLWSRRTPGPIRRVAYFERRCWMTLAKPLRPVVMGPRLRGGDVAFLAD